MDKKKLKRHKSNCMGLTCIALTVFFSVLGIGYAAWIEGLSVQGTVTTGYIDPVFSKCEVIYDNSSSALAVPVIRNNGKTLLLNVHDAHPCYSATFQYMVVNRGTIPVECSIIVKNTNPKISVLINQPTDIIDGFGDSLIGTVTLEVNEVDENTEYNFSTELNFQQRCPAK